MILQKIKALFVVAFLAMSFEANAGERIISLMPSYTEIIFALGIEKSKVVAITDKCNYPTDKTGDIFKIGDAFAINTETLVSLKPTVVFANSYQKKTIAQIERYNKKTDKSGKIKLVILKNCCKITDVYDNIKKIAFHLNKTKQAESIIKKMKSTISKIQNLSQYKPKVYVYIDIDRQNNYTAGGDTFVSDIVEKAGGINIFSGMRGYPDINWEYVYKSTKMDFILCVYGANPGKKIPKHAIVISDIEPDLLSREGPRLHIAVSELFRRFNTHKNAKRLNSRFS